MLYFFFSEKIFLYRRRNAYLLNFVKDRIIRVEKADFAETIYELADNICKDKASEFIFVLSQFYK